VAFDTDKISHGYLPVYLKIASEIGITGHVAELGVHAGGSLAMWQSLFPSGLVAGVDYVETCVWPEGTHKILTTQTSVALPGQLTGLSPGGYDLIVDDCSHDGTLTRRSWELLWPLVKPGRYYVIEDWQVAFPPWQYGTSMLTTAQSFLPIVGNPAHAATGLESAEYRFGMVILRKSATAQPGG
jgi:hypothetical protein